MTCIIFWYKIWNENLSLSESYIALMFDYGFQNFGGDIPSGSTQGWICLEHLNLNLFFNARYQTSCINCNEHDIT